MKLSKLSFRNFVHNVYNAFAYDSHQYDLTQRKQLEYLRLYMVYNQMKQYFNEDNSAPYLEELDYVMRKGVCHFPYEQQKTVGEVETGYDRRKKMPYVIHKGKRLYFPHDYTEEMAGMQYRRFIEVENLLGGGYTKKAPHQYQTENFKVEEGDVFVDVGAAEGLVALDVVDKSSKVILIESDSYWLPSLKASFEPYKEKCTIVHKLVSNKNTLSSVTLGKLLQNERQKPVFIKMDIEGNETSVLYASKDFLREADAVKVACCTYHKHNDAHDIASFFEQLGYQFEFSDGWMIHWTLEEEPIYPPFFRHGLLRAKKNRSI